MSNLGKGAKPHIKVAFRVELWPGEARIVWNCESFACSASWTYANGDSPRGAYYAWRTARDQERRLLEERRRARTAYLNRNRAPTNGNQNTP